MSRVRSPNYPMIGLAAAIEKTRMIHKGEGKNTIAREAIAKLIGYGGLNGGSSTMISALNKYGLLESKGGGEARVSDLAMRILAPESNEEKKIALEEAAFKPVIFSEIREKWPDRPPGDESLRSFLTRKGFTESALEQVIQFYREIIDIAMPAQSVQNTPPKPKLEELVLETPILEPKAVVAPQIVLESKAVPIVPEGKPFSVAFDGTVLTGSMAIRSVRDIDRLMKVLNAQKAAFLAMQDDDDEPGIGEE